MQRNAMTATAEVSWDAIVVTAQSLEVASAVASELRAATPDTLVLGVPDPGERATYASTMSAMW